MGISDKIKSKLAGLNEGDFPDDFEPKKQVKKSDDELAKYLKDLEVGGSGSLGSDDDENEDKLQEEKDLDGDSGEFEEMPKSKKAVVKKGEAKKEEPEQLKSSFTSQLIINLEKGNVEKTKELLAEVVKKGYGAMIKIEKNIVPENLEKTSSFLKYLAENDYSTVLIAVKSEKVFDD